LYLQFLLLFMQLRLRPTLHLSTSGELGAVCSTLGVHTQAAIPLFTLLGWLWTRIFPAWVAGDLHDSTSWPAVLTSNGSCGFFSRGACVALDYYPGIESCPAAARGATEERLPALRDNGLSTATIQPCALPLAMHSCLHFENILAQGVAIEVYSLSRAADGHVYAVFCLRRSLHRPEGKKLLLWLDYYSLSHGYHMTCSSGGAGSAPDILFPFRTKALPPSATGEKSWSCCFVLCAWPWFFTLYCR
jgi:hypothetical protein